MTNLNELIISNDAVKQWFNLLKNSEKHTCPQIIDQIIGVAEKYNSFFNGFGIFITGSSLNLINRQYNDIDLMVVIPETVIRTYKNDSLKVIWENFKVRDIDANNNLLQDTKVQLIDLLELVKQTNLSLYYYLAIQNSDREYLQQRLSSINEVNKILMDPNNELEATKMRVEGLLAEERNRLILEPDGTAGYQFGPLVEQFLRDTTSQLTRPLQDGKPWCNISWHKSFSEGYGKTAGENHCHIYPRGQAVPVHLFLTTGIDYHKAMEKKESFMIEYYTVDERMRPIKLY